jgi:hypothetical protein
MRLDCRITSASTWARDLSRHNIGCHWGVWGRRKRASADGIPSSYRTQVKDPNACAHAGAKPSSAHKISLIESPLFSREGTRPFKEIDKGHALIGHQFSLLISTPILRHLSLRIQLPIAARTFAICSLAIPRRCSLRFSRQSPATLCTQPNRTCAGGCS